MSATPGRPQLTICVQDKIGGVQSFFASLEAAGAFAGFNTRFIALSAVEDRDAKPVVSFTAPTQVVVHSRINNCHHTFRRLSDFIPAESGAVLTNFALELQCLDMHRRPDLTVFHFCHDEDYVTLARQFAHVIDVFVAHNPHFAERLKAELPPNRADDVLFLPFGICQHESPIREPNPNAPLRVVFLGRLHQLKGVLDVPLVDAVLRAEGVTVRWRILGAGPERGNLVKAMAGLDNFTVESPRDGQAMLTRAADGDVLFLPSRLDGTPVALMEAMSVGLVPVISEFNPGAHWMVPEHVGFVLNDLRPATFARLIARLHHDRSELELRSAAALLHARDRFNVEKQAPAYSTILSSWARLKRSHREPPGRYGGRLDKPWLPNAFVTSVRRSLLRRTAE